MFSRSHRDDILLIIMNPTSRHTPVRAATLPAPVGPYSPGMRFEQLIFVSGQGATDPATGRLAGVDATAQTEQCLRNLQAILRAGGSDLQYVLRCGVFLVDMAEFPQMNAVYARVFGDHRPARTTVEVSKLPSEGLRVEIDCIAYRPKTQRGARPVVAWRLVAASSLDSDALLHERPVR